MQVELTPFQWIAHNIQVVGWPVVVYAAIHCTVKFVRFLDKWQDRAELIDKLATNHFPHMEKSLISIDESMTKLTGQFDQYLTGIDTNVKILLDRSDYREISKKHTEG